MNNAEYFDSPTSKLIPFLGKFKFLIHIKNNAVQILFADELVKPKMNWMMIC